MSTGWDVISDVIKHTVGLVTNPAGEAARIVAEIVEPQVVDGEARPESSSPPSAKGALPPAPLELPPPPPAGPDSGQAADASKMSAEQVKAILNDLAELDKDAAATVESIHAAGQAGAKALDGIQRDVEAKIGELGPRLNTPDGQQELRNFLTEKLAAAKTLLEQQIADAEAKARATQDIAQKYSDSARTDGASQADSGESGSTDHAGGSTSPAATATGDASTQGTTPAAAATTAAPASGPQIGMLPGVGMMPGGMPMPAMPSFGGGGVPGLGGGDPLGALGGLSGLAGAHEPQGAEGQFHDDAKSDGASEPDSGGSKLHDDGAEAATSGTEAASHHGSTDTDSGTQPAAAVEPSSHSTPLADSDAGAHETGSSVKLPDGTSTDARNDAAASAVRAALKGTPVSEAYRQAGVELPPPGTPVTDPVPPTQLKAGDVGVWKDHMVMALGNGKVLVSGQVQPQSSMGSGPDFLGWINPDVHGQNASSSSQSDVPQNNSPSSSS